MKSPINPFFSQFSKNSNKAIKHFRNALFFFSLLKSSRSSHPTKFVHSLSYSLIFPSSTSLYRNYCRAIYQIKKHSIYFHFKKPKSLPSHNIYPYHWLSYDIYTLQSRKSKSFKSLIQKLKDNYKTRTNK